MIVDNYIYFHHIDRVCLIPQYPESVTDSMQASFGTTSILGRSAPIYTYSGSGPRSISMSLVLHREMLLPSHVINNYSAKFKISNVITNDGLRDISISNDDAVDTLIKTMEAAVLPKYMAATKAVNPPIVSVRIGKELYIKGVCRSVTHVFSGPILGNTKKYSVCTLQFQVDEISPYDAELVRTIGKFRVGAGSR